MVCDRGVPRLQMPAIPALRGHPTTMVWYGLFSAVPKEIPTVKPPPRTPETPVESRAPYSTPGTQPMHLFRQMGPKYPPQGPALAPAV